MESERAKSKWKGIIHFFVGSLANQDYGIIFVHPTKQATASVVPLHWQPNSGLVMTNDPADNPEDAVPCIALSKNDSYVMSACGGKVSLFNMMTFKVRPCYFIWMYFRTSGRSDHCSYR